MMKSESFELLDNDGYPTEDALAMITNWEPTDFSGLLSFVKSLWRWPERVWLEGEEYILSTGGWSGNESLVDAMHSNRLFWLFCWQSSSRGGRFVFRLPEGKLPT